MSSRMSYGFVVLIVVLKPKTTTLQLLILQSFEIFTNY